MFCVYTIQPFTTSRYFMQSHIRRVHACLAVTCHLHFWHNHRDLMRATAVVRGWNGYGNKSAQKVYPGEINSPDTPGFEPATVNGISHLAASKYKVPKTQTVYSQLMSFVPVTFCRKLWFCGCAHDFKYITFFINSFRRISFFFQQRRRRRGRKLLKGDGTPLPPPPPSLPPPPNFIFFIIFINRNCRRTGCLSVVL